MRRASGLSALLVCVLFGTLAVGARAATPPLRFGIYPGGSVGQTTGGATGRATESLDQRLPLLRELEWPDNALVLHLYGAWFGDRPVDDEVDAALREAEDLTAQGFWVELVLRYRPSRPKTSSPGHYAGFVRRVVERAATNPLIKMLQITNEANVAGAPAASDGAYRGARLAIVHGVLAAERAAVRADRRDLKIGFNWAAAGNTGPDARFWRRLRATGGRPFARAVDWVGIDFYPGTFHDLSATTPDSVWRATTRTLGYARRLALPWAGLGRRTALHISENGFPTGALRDENGQASLMSTAIQAMSRHRGTYGVTDYRWFDLRDSLTGSDHPEDNYGIVRTDYTKKVGFDVFRDLVRRFGRRR